MDLSCWLAAGGLLGEEAYERSGEPALSPYRRMIQEVAEGRECRPLQETLAAVLDRTGYRRMLEEEGTEDARARVANLEELLNAPADAAPPGESLRGFLDPPALLSDPHSVDSPPQASLPPLHTPHRLAF